MHRAIISLMEELEAGDWCKHRLDACEDFELKVIMAHNRNEEKSMQQWYLNGYAEKTMLFQNNLKASSLPIKLLLMASDESMVVKNSDVIG